MNTWGTFNVAIPMATDSYKAGHWNQYPAGTEYVGSYMESRGSKLADFTVFFGLQYYLKKYLSGVVVTENDVNIAENFWTEHLGPGTFAREKWMHIVKNHGGKLPIRIKAVKEGTKVPTHNVLMVIENTDPDCFWLTNFIETLLMKVWYPTTIATHSYIAKQKILEYLELTGTPASIDFRLHDFSYRSCTSEEQAVIGSMSHLVHFMGTDTVAGIWGARTIYNTDEMVAWSVKASEHGVVLSFGGEEHEIEYFRNMLVSTPTGIVSCVSDTYHILKAIDKLGELKDIIMNREGTLVVRPDSGDPAMTDLMVIEKLGAIFGYTVNEKGYKVLDPHVRVIQGDGVNLNSIGEILALLEKHKWSADNITFGCGTKLMQEFSRDTFNFAIKASKVIVAGETRYVEKSPTEIDKDGNLHQSFKKSKKGDLKLVKTVDGYKTINNFDEGFESAVDELVTVFENGEILKEYSFGEVRETAKN